ncbi:hypothetical protein Pcinc_021553 [Petrolisthes cinctipes]|uniref:Kinetochore-associated protein 1 n=1 Tax=Petrolisthes cinctipes TaxID=88211 RepID=A0AAE1FFQ6_PETCI|nr:hypothetical protein Pcinc_021553 [Petrolisthes cinctipes]
MVVWEVLDAEADDETRQSSDMGSLTSLYEVVKLAYLQPDDVVGKLPKVSASKAWGRVALALDNTLFVFGEGSSLLLMQLDLQAQIDLVLWIPQGDFLIVGDSGGDVHCVHVSSQRVLITQHLPIKKKDFHVNLFAGGGCTYASDGTLTITFITSSGQVFRLENIELEALADSIQAGDIENLKHLKEQMTLATDNIDVKNSEVSAVENVDKNFLVWCNSDGGTTLWLPSSLHNPSQPLTWNLMLGMQCTRIISVCENRYIVTLSNLGCLGIVCGVTGMMLWEGDEDDPPVLDMTLLQGDEQENQLLLLLHNPSGDGNLLRIVSFPKFQTVYELVVSSGTKLVNIGEGAESITFLEPDVSCGTGFINSLKLKSIVDGVPEARLAKLLAKNRFKEAEEFCVMFNLDTEEVYKARTKYLCDLMNPWLTSHNNLTHNDLEGSDVFDMLLQNLEKIKDAEFVTALCIGAQLPDIATTKKILNYAKERLARTAKSNEGDQLSSLMQRVSESIYRLRTFETIFPTSDIQHWLAFSHTDMLEEFTIHLSRSNLDLASTLWHRHLYEFSHMINQSCVSEILEAFPHNIPTPVQCSWLAKHMLSDFIKFCPSSVDIIAEWADNRVKNLEVQESGAWPSNGLSLANTVISVLNNVGSDSLGVNSMEVKFVAVHIAQTPSTSLKHLRLTALALQDLKFLSEEFRIKLKFNEYMQESKDQVVAVLLDHLVCGEQVEPLMDSFLSNYMVRHELDTDSTLKQYVLDTLAFTDHSWWAWEVAPWEDKVYAVLRIMSDIEMRAGCVVECLRVAPVPWSKGTEAICDLALSVKTSQQDKLEDQRRLVGLKCVLRRYSIRSNSIDDPVIAEMILKNIVSSNEETAMEDALCVVNTYRHLSQVDAYFFRALHLLKNRKFEDVKCLLSGLNKTPQEKVCQKLVLFSTQTLLSQPIGQKGRDLHEAVTEGMMVLECLVKRPNQKPKGLLTEMDIFATVHNLNALQMQYNIYPTLKELENKERSQKLLEVEVTKWYKSHIHFPIEKQPPIEDSQGRAGRKSCLLQGPSPTPSQQEENNVWNGLDYLLRLAELLGVSRGYLFSFLASLSARSARFDEAVQLCQEIIKDPGVGDSTAIIYEVVKLMVEQQDLGGVGEENSLLLDSSALQERNAKIKSNANLISIINELVCSLLTFTHPDLLKTFLELVEWCGLAETLYSRCHVEGLYTQTSDTRSSDPYTTWKFSPVFRDVCMPLEESCIRAVMTQVLNGWLGSRDAISDHQSYIPYNKDNGGGNMLENPASMTSLQSLISHLRDRGQDALAMLLSMQVNQYFIISELNDTSPKCPMDWQQVFTILFKIIGSPRPDITLAVSLLMLLPKKDALKVTNELVKKFGFDYTKLTSLGTAGKDYCIIQGLNDIKEQFEVLLKRAQWGKSLGEKNISFKEAFKGDSVAIRKVLTEIVFHPDCSFSLLRDYCTYFRLDITDALLCYLKATLHSWSPTIPDKEESSSVAIRVNPPRDILSKCRTIIANMNNMTALLNMLEVELNKLSPYNYEIIELVLCQLTYLDEEGRKLQLLQRGLDLVNFLIVYTRESSLSHTEIDDWNTNHPQSLGPPEIAKYRLPFHAFFNKDESFKAIIGAELSITTIDAWLQASNIMKLTTDHLCLVATKNTVSKSLEQNNMGKTNQQGNKWQLCKQHSALLAQVHSVICKMKDYKLATSCANWVVNRLPAGADKLEAAKETVLFSKQWQASSDQPSVEEACITIKDRYQQLAVEHTLHKHNLAEPQYLALARSPVDLVTSLYQHPTLHSMTTLSVHSTHSMLDINTCVTELCDIAGCNLVHIQLDLLEKWLPPCESDENACIEETVTNFKLALDPGSSTEEKPENDITLSRVIYLLGCCPQEESVSYLLNCALNDDTSISATHRLRALHCLLAIANEKVIQKHYLQGISSIRSLKQTLMYVSRLESLGHATSVQQFNTMDKSALVEGLWRSQRHNPSALCLITDICHDYKITTTTLWSAVLTQLNNFVKVGKLEINILENVLLQTNSLPHLWVIPALTTAWTTLLHYPFVKASAPVSESSLERCIHSVDLLLHHCPVVVPSEPLLELCNTLDLPLLALTIAAADHMEFLDLKAIMEKSDKSVLQGLYNNLKPTFAFPKRVEELMEHLYQ